jgi:hypothetical protein
MLVPWGFIPGFAYHNLAAQFEQRVTGNHEPVGLRFFLASARKKQNLPVRRSPAAGLFFCYQPKGVHRDPKQKMHPGYI